MNSYVGKILKKILNLPPPLALVNCTMAYLKIPRRNVMRVYEFLNIKACSYTNSSSKDLFDVLEEKVEEDIGYDQWINNTKEALKTSKGRFWLGKVSVNVHFCI